MKYKERAELTDNKVAKTLFELMDQKETNLCVAADLTDFSELIELINKIGNEICILKTHIDIIENLPDDFAKQLLELKEKYNFLIFEDRKFADIGNTVKMQYQKGMYHIVEWADITNCHSVPGPGIIEGLKEVADGKERGLLLLAQMSSQDNLAQGKYTEKTIEMAKKYDDFVIGFIGMKKLVEDNKFITMTPGVKLVEGTDNLKQQYNTPEKVITSGSDIIIVGRGIYESANPEEEAKKYREEGFNAYKTREY
ncbi:orotidine-5'-phosphate decarboxylase [bacterium]|jgi:orotidine 5'-phosphate decarboxylase subfamily 1|nr:orotidine-5'-phosphate decarboxylase [bacterium]MBT4122166.1 orotidine-5'-phosphate decarboxylase [bacterium]MBT4495631.1 orotidine-5'-phosphate decarboxylase [bacterium]MBT4763581.1 orotidine-5'-phosphate decarboxylase [bacterium]MBT5400953.1 orotidine-5'-phosphate decarboxylase [bacterium]